MAAWAVVGTDNSTEVVQTAGREQSVYTFPASDGEKACGGGRQPTITSSGAYGTHRNISQLWYSRPTLEPNSLQGSKEVRPAAKAGSRQARMKRTEIEQDMCRNSGKCLKAMRQSRTRLVPDHNNESASAEQHRISVVVSCAVLFLLCHSQDGTIRGSDNILFPTTNT